MSPLLDSAARKRLLFAGVFLLSFRRAAAYQAEVEPVPARAYAEAALREINEARVSVDVFMYAFSLRPDQKDSLPLQLAEALRRARDRGVKVRVVLDRGPDPGGFSQDPEARNGAARDYLAAAGIPVFLDDPQVVTHAKALIVDGKTVLLGSTNWTTAAFTQNVEADALVRSPEFARDLLLELDRNVPVPAPAEAQVQIPLEFLARPDLLGRMVTRRDDRAFDTALYLFKRGRVGEKTELVTADLADALGLGQLMRSVYRSEIQRTLATLQDTYRLVRLTRRFGQEPLVEFLPPAGSTGASVPPEYWSLGWNTRLDLPGKAFYLLSLYYSSVSPGRPSWTVSREDLAARHHVSPAFISMGVTALRRAGLIDVASGELTKDPCPRDTSVYTPRPLYDAAELDRRFEEIRTKYGDEKLARARNYAAEVYDDSDAAGVEQLIRLEEEFGPERVKWTADKIGMKDPDNPRRTLGYLIGMIRTPDKK